ncbi:uroporphyrinogen-III synthase [Phenylobacterium sp.]|jgi:uroporphyrinogen-III synthase|uniref:uroporphyrinogen-III synthase n=1 Tax=Phenylobacterium sp. TaxID=1871053 RepID=UPI002F3FA087
MSEPPLKVWITRAQPGAGATAVRVRALGHEPFVAPLLSVAPQGRGPIDLAGVGALAFTSANGVRAFAARSPERALCVFAVGEATAKAARATGFAEVLASDGDVADLAERIAVRRRGLAGEVLHPGAAEPAGDLTGRLRGLGLAARSLAVYRSEPAAFGPEQAAALGGLDLALVHSPKAAAALAEVLAAFPAPRLRVLAISEAAIRPLAGTPLAGKVFAPRPSEAALLNLIGRRA